MTNPEAALRALEDSRTYVLANYKSAAMTECDNQNEARLIRLIDKGLLALRQIEAAPSPPDSSLVVGPADSSQGEPLPPIDYNKEYDRYYIPLPGGWEVQTKGKGSSFRIANTKDDNERLNIPNSPYLYELLERMAREIHAASTAPPPSSPQVAVADGPTITKMHEQWFKFGDWSAEQGVCNVSFGVADIEKLKSAAEGTKYVLCQSAPADDEPLFTVSMYGTAERAAKAREEWLAAKGEPQGKHWKDAVVEVLLEHADDIEIEAPELNRLIEQRARSLAAKGEGGV